MLSVRYRMTRDDMKPEVHHKGRRPSRHPARRAASGFLLYGPLLAGGEDGYRLFESQTAGSTLGFWVLRFT